MWGNGCSAQSVFQTQLLLFLYIHLILYERRSRSSDASNFTASNKWIEIIFKQYHRLRTMAYKQTPLIFTFLLAFQPHGYDLSLASFPFPLSKPRKNLSNSHGKPTERNSLCSSRPSDKMYPFESATQKSKKYNHTSRLCWIPLGSCHEKEDMWGK